MNVRPGIIRLLRRLERKTSVSCQIKLLSHHGRDRCYGGHSPVLCPTFIKFCKRYILLTYGARPSTYSLLNFTLPLKFFTSISASQHLSISTR